MAELAALEAAGRRRHLHPPQGVDFCSNDYLGLAAHPAIRAALAAALSAAAGAGQQAIPLGGGSSRLIRGEDPRWARLEQRFAQFCGAEAALYFPSGYAANLGLLASLAGRGDVIFSDRLNHASLIDGMRLSGAERVRIPHLDLAAWEAALASYPAKPAQRRLAVVESVYSMEGDFAPIAALAALCARHDVALIVDEAHATGIFGPDGAGLVAANGAGPAPGVGGAGSAPNRQEGNGRWPAAVLAVIHTCGKAWGAAGAFVTGPAWLRDYLINRARTFIFTTAPPPLLAVQLAAALDTAAAEPWRRARVRGNAGLLRQLLAAASIATAGPAARPASRPDRDTTAGRPVHPDAAESPIIPVLLGADARAVAVSQRLAAAGFDVRAIRPPTVPEGTARLRLTVHAGHTPQQIEALAAALAAAVSAAPAAPPGAGHAAQLRP